jgi:hypothetical protein
VFVKYHYMMNVLLNMNFLCKFLKHFHFLKCYLYLIKNLPIIEYSHLLLLNLINVYDDYVVQFLDDKKTYLPSIFRLAIDSESLKRVTHNFTTDTMRINCDKIKELCILDTVEEYERLKNYFPRAHLC